MGFCAHPAPTWTASACSSLFEARDRIPGRLPGRIRLCPECHGTGRVTSIRRELLLKKVKGWARTNLSVARPARPRKNAGTHTAHVDPPRDYAVRVLRMVSAHKPALPVLSCVRLDDVRVARPSARSLLPGSSRYGVDAAGKSEGAFRVLVYLFRDEDRPTTFAYSTDVTGRNLPRLMPGTSWVFVTAASLQEIPECEEA